MPSYAAPAGSSLHCSPCSSAVDRCHPRSKAKASAETEAERWFSRSPFCSQHSHDMVVMYQGKGMGLEELWKRKWQEVAPRSRSSYRHEDGHGERELERDWHHRSRSKDYQSKSKDHRSRSRDDRSRSRRKESRRDQRTKKSNGKKSSSDSDSSSESSDDEDVEARYCKACELALAKCRIWNIPNPAARLESQKYFLKPPVCLKHFHRKDVVKDDELISLEDLWKEMKAREPCDVCDAAKKAARPLPSPYENARTEGEKYFLPIPFCARHRKREDIVCENEIVSVRKYWKTLKKEEVCMACEAAKKWCSPLQMVNNHAFTEGERWFYPSPLCLRHKDCRKILVDAKMIKMEDYWKIRVKAAREEARKVAEKRRDSGWRGSVTSEERGRSRNDERQRRKSEMAPGLLSPYDPALQHHRSRARPRSTVDPLRGTTDASTQDRRRPRSYDASRSYDDHRKSRSPSPYPDGWTEDQKKKYFECFRTLAQPQKVQEAADGWSGHFPSPPPTGTASFHASPTPTVASPGLTSSATANFLSPSSAINGSCRETDHAGGSYFDPGDSSKLGQSSQTDDSRSFVEKLGIRSPSPART